MKGNKFFPFSRVLTREQEIVSNFQLLQYIQRIGCWIILILEFKNESRKKNFSFCFDVSANDVFYAHSVSIEMSKHGMVDTKLIQKREGNAKVQCIAE